MKLSPMSQPTVSEHIQTLEEAFGTLLFERMARHVRSTRAGDHLYERARRVGELRRGIEEGMARFLKRLEGRLVIGASTIPGEYLLPPLIGSYRESHPGVRLSVAVRDSKGVLDDLEAARIDLGFVGIHPVDGYLKSQKFASDNLVLIVPATRRWKGMRSISLRELRKEPFLVRERGSGTRSALESRLKQLGLSLEDFNVVAELGSTTAIKEAVRAGVGASVISFVAVKRDLAGGRVRELRVREIGLLQRDFYRVFDARRTKSPLCDSFLEHLDRRPAADAPQSHHR